MSKRRRNGSTAATEATPITSWRLDADSICISVGRDDLSAATLRGIAARSGRESGLAAAQGHHFADRIDDLPGRKRLSAAGRERIEVLDRCLRRQLQTANAALAGLEERVKRETDKATQAESTETERQKNLDGLVAEAGHRNSTVLGLVGYGALLLLLSLAEFPSIYTSLRSSFLAPWSVNLISVALSVIVAACAHVVGTSLRAAVSTGDATQSADSQDGKRSHERATNFVIVAIITIAMLGLVYFMYLTRSNLFANALQHRKTEGLRVSGIDPELLSITLLALQVLLFCLATVVSYHRAAGADERRIATESRRRRKHIKKAAKSATKAAAAAGSARDRVTHGLESTRQQVDLIKDDLTSFRSQEEQLLVGLFAEHDAAFESAKHRRDPIDRDPVVFGGAPVTEFHATPAEARS